MRTLSKDASDRDSFGFAYTNQVASGDAIASSTWTADPGITLESPSYSGLITSVFVDGGTPGSTYTLRNKITTTAGRRLERAFRLVITDDA